MGRIDWNQIRCRDLNSKFGQDEYIHSPIGGMGVLNRVSAGVEYIHYTYWYGVMGLREI